MHTTTTIKTIKAGTKGAQMIDLLEAAPATGLSNKDLAEATGATVARASEITRVLLKQEQIVRVEGSSTHFTVAAGATLPPRTEYRTNGEAPAPAAEESEPKAKKTAKA